VLLVSDRGLALPPELLAFESLSKTAFALLNLDTRLAVRLRPPFELAFEPVRDGDNVVEPLMLVLLPLLGELLVISLSPIALIPCMEEVVLHEDRFVEPPLSRSIDMAWRRFASNWRALLVTVEPIVRLLISFIVVGPPPLSLEFEEEFTDDV